MSARYYLVISNTKIRFPDELEQLDVVLVGTNTRKNVFDGVVPIEHRQDFIKMVKQYYEDDGVNVSEQNS